MSVTQYIGARYVPLFADPLEWDANRDYEPLTIVLHQGNSFTSRQDVPKGIDITNTDFWAMTGNYNAQIEQYRREVQAFDGLITANAQAIADEVANRMAADSEIRAIIDTLATKEELQTSLEPLATKGEVSSAVAAEATARESADNALEERIDAQAATISTLMRQGQKVVIFSDSTFQTNPDPRTGVNQKSIADILTEITGATVINLGHGGYTTQDIIDQMGTMSPTEIADADYVILASGTNDWAGAIPPIPIVSGATCFQLVYENMVRRAQTLAPRAQIVCVTPGYVHSTESSVVLNMNATGNDIKAYCDVIEHVADMLNVAILRLDNLLGINEQTYTSKMVPSGAAGTAWENIWYHYAEGTNRKVADMLAFGMYAANARGQIASYTDVTPSWWYNGAYTQGRNADYYGYEDSPTIVVKKSDGIVTPSLMEGVEYWFGFRGAIKATIAGRVMCDVSNQGVSMFPIVGAGEPVTILLEYNPRPTDEEVEIIGPKLTIGRPSVYDATKRLIGYANRRAENDTWEMQAASAIATNTVKVKNKSNFTLPSDQTAPFPDLPISGLDGFVSGVCVNSAGAWTNIYCRIDRNGKMYLNEIPDGFGGSTIITCSLLGVSF